MLVSLQTTGGETAAEVAIDFLQILGFAGAGLVLGVVAAIILTALGAALKRHNPVWEPFFRRLRVPVRVLLVILGTGVGVLVATQQTVSGVEVPWRPLFVQIFTIVLIIAAAYLLSSLLLAVEDAVVLKYENTSESRQSRRARTQMQMIRQIGTAVVWISAVVAALMTFPSFQGIGTTFFASAGVASIIAGVALQSTLANVFAGIQIAFTDSLRVGDVVVADSQQGTVQELTLTYVVLRVWDGRNLVLPSTFFTTTPFENWTRRETDLLGTVLIDVDWFTPVPALRVELERLVESSGLWDGRRASLQVVNAEKPGVMTVRAVVSAADSGKVWDLSCEVREGLIRWMQENAAYSVPRTRIEPETTTAPPVEERQEFIADVERTWEEERPEDYGIERETAPVEPEEDDSMFGWLWGHSDTGRARKAAEKADKKASKSDPTILAGHDRVLPLPSAEETVILTSEQVEELSAGASTEEAGTGATTRGRRPAGGRSATGGSNPARNCAGGYGPSGGRSPAAGASTPDRSSIRTPDAPVYRSGESTPTSADSRLYSGSPEAEERGRLMQGPGPEEMADRERAARRRGGGRTADTSKLPEGPIQEDGDRDD